MPSAKTTSVPPRALPVHRRCIYGMSKAKTGQKSPHKASSTAPVKAKSAARVSRARDYRRSAPPKISRAWEGSRLELVLSAEPLFATEYYPYSPTAAAQSDSGVFSQSQTIAEPLPRLSFGAAFDGDPGFQRMERERRKATSAFMSKLPSKGFLTESLSADLEDVRNGGSGPHHRIPSDDGAMNEVISDSQKEVNNSSETEPDTPTQRPRQPLNSNANDADVPMSTSPGLNDKMPLDSADSLLDSLARCIDALTASREEEFRRCERLRAQMNRFRMARTKEKKMARDIQEALLRIQAMLEKERSRLLALAADIEFN
ncbi:hypothetical protein BDN70DRAFT_936786 [Pholiota conissans]|uniref:Uncharacterized protein n=1 Tax=Pholiota conissans TaxID=109636 RepID=A0A9P5YRT3_9AGAR|nr:hypothetical protein BDN70DRAFT_936786 [Pholiota conissans]